MGLLIEGEWCNDPPRDDASEGRYQRSEAPFRNWVTADGAPGPSGEGGFAATDGRYHLYVSYACPWAHRTLVYRKLKGLEEIIGVSCVHWYMGDRGWSFDPDDAGIVEDRLFGSEYLHQIYTRAKRRYTGRVSVPVLWDRERGTIVSNESAEIIRMFNTVFDDLGASSGDYYPAGERRSIDAINDRVYRTLNNGVYRCGFATTQRAYEESVYPLFDTLDWLEAKLRDNRFLLGNEPLECDWRLLPTLLRFDIVYHGHFKCNLRRLIDYPNLWAYTRDLYQWPGIRDTCNFAHAKCHYHMSHESVNPHRIVPAGPYIDFDSEHGRGG